MDPSEVFETTDEVLRQARKIHDESRRYAKPSSAPMDPSMLFAIEDSFANCKDCGKVVEMCVCSAIDDALLDTLIQQVSVPNLAALYQKAQDQGLVKPMYHYQSNS